MADTNHCITVHNEFHADVHANHAGFGAGGTGGPERPRRITGRLTEPDIERIREHNVAPACQAEAVQALAIHHVIIIEGPRGIGKRAGAVVALRDRTTGPLVVLDPMCTPRDLATHEYQAGTGYLVSGHVDTGREPGTEHGWLVVRNAVRDAGAYLVVTRPTGARVEDIPSVRWERPPLDEVVRAHLAGAEQAVDELLAALPADCALRDIARLAERIVAGDPVAVALQYLGIAPADRVRAWFDTGPSEREILEITAAAFHSGCTRIEFDSVTAGLLARFPGAADMQRGPGPDIVVMDPETGTHLLIEAKYRKRVLAELNDRQPEVWWRDVRAWLADTVRQEENLSIAGALALLAESDVAVVERSYLEPWSQGTLGRSGQVTAVFTLWHMCFTPALVPVALRVVRGWASHGSREQRRTAALALSGELGVRFPGEAVRGILALLEQGPEADEKTYADALAALFAVLQQENEDGAIVFGQLRDLAEQGDRDQALRCALAVLNIHNGPDGEPSISGLLRDQPEHADLVGGLWRELMDDDRFRHEAMNALLDGLGPLTPEQKGRVQGGLATPDSVVGRAPDVPRDVPPPPPEEEPRPYPVVTQRTLDPVRPRRFRFGKGRRVRDELPRPAAHEALVFHVDGDHVADTGRLGPDDDVVVRATHVSVVDVRPDTPIEVRVAIRSAQADPFIALIRFTCSVEDPALVVKDGLDARKRLHAGISHHQPLFELGLCHPLSRRAEVRRAVSAQLRALFEVSPVVLPGMRAALAGVELVTPSVQLKENE
ncbi:hypothetical protein Lesp02_66650 [Lentzea sp. NBRC 105346]|uniref:hypothetical protein n=1 Tax=Lentzea sp. NBRC 105346 TaxID=3032205 RepID=UPI00249FA584|nr:hypothetical protein [Lentzea sp. NBRC 105346]GLZ34478.1 hypothetical protein Lesp02_66650 [Lentzea sp. NBRC 105346]